MAEPDWSQLPKDLLQLISQKLNSDFYELRFRSVCSSWRSSSIPKHLLLLNNLPSKLPFPLPFKSINTSTFPLSKRTIFLINQQQSLTPWLIKIGLDSHGRTRLWNPLSRDNLLSLHFPQHIDFNQLSVFQLAHEYVIGNFPSKSEQYSFAHTSIFTRKVAVYDTLRNQNGNGNDRCSVLLTIHISGKLAIFRNGDERWTVMRAKPPKPYTDVCVFNGRPIAVDSTGRTVAVGQDLSLHLVAKAVSVDNRKLLVESDGELLLVDMYLKPDSTKCNMHVDGEGVYEFEIESDAVRFVVFRLDEKEKKWVELTNLGDRVLFLGEDCAFSVSASDLCMGNGNCVIFGDNVHRLFRLPELGISVFCLDKRQILPSSDFPSCSKLFWPPPQWAGLR
jgi:hypothetical protein